MSYILAYIIIHTYTHTHTDVHTYVHTHKTHTSDIHTYIGHTCIGYNTHIHSRRSTCVRAHMRTYVHMHIRACVRPRTAGMSGAGCTAPLCRPLFSWGKTSRSGGSPDFRRVLGSRDGWGSLAQTHGGGELGRARCAAPLCRKRYYADS